MKKSHRKDVILARFVFAGICVIIIAAIFSAVLWVKEHRASVGTESEVSQESQSQSEMKSGDTEDTEPEHPTEPTQAKEPDPIVVQTTTALNLRKEPNTSCEVLTVLAAGTRLEVLGEEDGWANVSYLGQIGYVSMDYIEEVAPEEGGQAGE